MGVLGKDVQPNPDATSITGAGLRDQTFSLALIFWDEIRLLDDFANPISFEGGYVTEILGNGKYKVNRIGANSVVTAVCSSEATSAIFPWQKSSNSNIQKGALVLMVVDGTKSSVQGSKLEAKYMIISWRQSGVFAPKSASEYPV